MTDFNYYEGIREDVGHMIGEVGVSLSVRTPTITKDAYGNHVSTSWATTTETAWIRLINEVMEISNVGQLNREDLRIEVAYTSILDLESEIIYNGNTYTIVSMDAPGESGFQTHKVGFAKKKLS